MDQGAEVAFERPLDALGIHNARDTSSGRAALQLRMQARRAIPGGLYRRARAGKIADFTGVSAPYGPPERPELTVDTGDRPLQALVDCVERQFALNGRTSV